jgi:hypothetical protein
MLRHTRSVQPFLLPRTYLERTRGSLNGLRGCSYSDLKQCIPHELGELRHRKGGVSFRRLGRLGYICCILAAHLHQVYLSAWIISEFGLRASQDLRGISRIRKRKCGEDGRCSSSSYQSRSYSSSRSELKTTLFLTSKSVCGRFSTPLISAIANSTTPSKNWN